MTAKEFSDNFDVQLNSYNQSIGDPLLIGGLNFDEYEKSVFLTEAQEQYVKHLYKGGYGIDGFEETQALRRQLDALVDQKDYIITPTNEKESASTVTIKDGYIIKDGNKISDNKMHTVFELVDDCWYIIYESAIFGGEDSCFKDASCDVVPVPHDIYNRTRRNPFRGPNNYRVLRLDKGNNKVELVSSLPIKQYTIRYIKRPYPIILVPLTHGITINGETQPFGKDSPCMLNDVVHQNILELAVKLAYASRATTSGTKKDNSDDD